MTSSVPSIAVYGASGHTGQFVVQDALRRGLRVVAVGRNAARLAALCPSGVECRVAVRDDPAALVQAFAGYGVVIHCANSGLFGVMPILNASIIPPFRQPPRIFSMLLIRSKKLPAYSIRLPPLKRISKTISKA